MSKIVRAIVTSDSKDDENHLVKITSEGLFKDLKVESVNGLYLRKDDVVFVYIDDAQIQPLILGRATGQLELTELVDVINKLIDVVNDDKKAFEGHKHEVTVTSTTTATVGPSAVPGVITNTVVVQTPDKDFADKMDNIDEDDLLKE